MVVPIILSGLAIGCIYSLVALGFSLMFRTTGLVNFAHGEAVTIGALFGYTMVSTLKLPLLPSILLVAFVSGILGALVERIAYRPIRIKKWPEVNGVIATVGMILVLANGAMLVWGAEPLAYPARVSESTLRLAEMTVPLLSIWILVLGLALMVFLHLFLRNTNLGKAMRAVADYPLMAQLTGINIDSVVTITFGFSAAFGGAAGVMLAPIYYASYNMGTVGLKSFSAAVLGGFGSVPGAMIGGLLLGVIETVGATYVSSSYKDAIAYGLLILLLLFRPTGLLGMKEGR